VKLFWDNPTSAWRTWTLTYSPRWYLNNLIGNEFFLAVQGVGPTARRRALTPEFQAAGPVGVRGGGLVISQRGFKPRIGDTLLDFNQRLETYARSASYLHEAGKQASRQILQESGKGFFDIRTQWEQFRGAGAFDDAAILKKIESFDPATQQRLIDTTNNWLLDYGSLTAIERQWIRRFGVPFWSWYREITKYAAKLPVLYPGRTQMLRVLSEVGQEATTNDLGAVLKEAGLSERELEEYQRGAVVLSKAGRLIDVLNPRSAMPLTDVTRGPGLHPFLNVAVEQLTGRRLFNGQAFSDPEVVEVKGRFYAREANGELRVVPPPRPDLFSHLLRQFPQVQLLEKLLKEQPQYDTTFIFASQPHRPLVPRDQTGEVKRRLASAIGVPLQQIDLHLLILKRKIALEAERKLMRRQSRE